MSSILALASPLIGLGLLSAPPGPAGPAAALAPAPGGGECSFVGASHAMSFQAGGLVNNLLVTSGDLEVRRFLVYVPSTYDERSAPHPVVYMFHGTGQTADAPVNKLTWDEAAEALEFIAVFPEALPYLLVDGSARTKWMTDNVASHVVHPSEHPVADDMLFVRELHNTLGAHLNIDCERIYASGFSNGGAFVKTKLRVEMTDVFAATSSAGGGGLRESEWAELFPANGWTLLPHFEVVGNLDRNKKLACIDAGDLPPGTPLPLAVADIIATPCMWDPQTTMAGSVGMDPAIYTTLEGPNRTQFLWASPSLPGTAPREYRFRILRNLTHEYPSGNNYPVDYVPIFYAWMSQYTKQG